MHDDPGIDPNPGWGQPRPLQSAEELGADCHACGQRPSRFVGPDPFIALARGPVCWRCNTPLARNPVDGIAAARARLAHNPSPHTHPDQVTPAKGNSSTTSQV